MPVSEIGRAERSEWREISLTEAGVTDELGAARVVPDGESLLVFYYTPGEEYLNRKTEINQKYQDMDPEPVNQNYLRELQEIEEIAERRHGVVRLVRKGDEWQIASSERVNEPLTSTQPRIEPLVLDSGQTIALYSLEKGQDYSHEKKDDTQPRYEVLKLALSGNADRGISSE